MMFAIPTVALLVAYQIVKKAVPKQTPQEEEVLRQEGRVPPASRLFREPTPTPSPVPLGYAKVVIRTKPTDATVYIDDEFVGKKSPTVITRQSNQNAYKLTVQRRGYEPYTKFYNVEADEEMVINVELRKVARR